MSAKFKKKLDFQKKKYLENPAKNIYAFTYWLYFNDGYCETRTKLTKKVLEFSAGVIAKNIMSKDDILKAVSKAADSIRRKQEKEDPEGLFEEMYLY